MPLALPLIAVISTGIGAVEPLGALAPGMSLGKVNFTGGKN
jgi:hypothetical protein